MKYSIILTLVCLFSISAIVCAQQILETTEYKVVQVSNPTDNATEIMTIALDFADFDGLKGITKDNIVIYSYETNKLILSQVINTDDNVQVLFQGSFLPNQQKEFAVLARPDNVSLPTTELSTFAEFYPKRDDDIAWENDKMAARMYGKGLEWETISCGIDLWCKEVARPIIAQKYTELFDQKLSYHESRGIGGDYYKVGPTLGCGGSAIIKDGKLLMPDHNFVSNKILANGPIRSVFELYYAPWDADGTKVSETIRVTIDLGSYLSKIEAKFDSDLPEFTVAAGIVTRETGGEIYSTPETGWIGYWQPREDFGTICCGIIVPQPQKVKAELAQNHTLLTGSVAKGKSFTYYAGGTWDKTGEIKNFADWKQYLDRTAKTLNTKLNITIK